MVPKHISHNLYLYPNFNKLRKTDEDQKDKFPQLKSGIGEYFISNRPWDRDCPGTEALKIQVEHATKYTLGAMGKRYCFVYANIKKIEHEKYVSGDKNAKL